MAYKQGKIYLLSCSQTGYTYVGHTFKSLHTRLSQHKGSTNKCMSKKLIDMKIELLENYPCNDKRELEKREQYYINMYSDFNVNKNNPYKKA